MDPEKVFNLQKQARNNARTIQSYMTDLQSWEIEMKRKEAALKGEFEQDLPPIRSKLTKEKPIKVQKKPQKRINSSDYTAWDNFDVEKACEEVDMEDVGPTSLDGKKSKQNKMEKLREEAQYEKERGNNFVKQMKWDEAISCYNRAIELVKDDAIYYANRGLCHLKKESLHQAESDCTEALRIDPTYVKALQRRATAREKLGSLRAASHDLNEIIRLEPHNAASWKQLEAIKARMGTKGTKSKSSPQSTPTAESKKMTSQPKIIELDDKSPATINTKKTESQKQLTPIERWMRGVDEAVTVITPVKKPPHLRSKTPLKELPIQEIKLGESSPEKPATRMKIIEIDDEKAKGDTNNNDANKDSHIAIKNSDIATQNSNIATMNSNIVTQNNIATQNSNVAINTENETKAGGDVQSSQLNGFLTPESDKLVKDSVLNEKTGVEMKDMVIPVNSVQFMSEWKCLKGNNEARSHYLSIIDPSKIPSIFENALESDVLSELLYTLKENKQKFKQKTVAAYLKGLVRVKRFSALAMFLSNGDKELIHKLLVHCRTAEGCSDQEIEDLKNKFEL